MPIDLVESKKVVGIQYPIQGINSSFGNCENTNCDVSADKVNIGLYQLKDINESSTNHRSKRVKIDLYKIVNTCDIVTAQVVKLKLPILKEEQFFWEYNYI